MPCRPIAYVSVTFTVMRDDTSLNSGGTKQKSNITRHMLHTRILQLPGSGRVVTIRYPAKFPTRPTSSFNFFRSRYLQDRRVDLHQIFQKDGKSTAVEKLSFWFMNSFGDGKEVRQGHFRFRRSFTKCKMAAK